MLLAWTRRILLALPFVTAGVLTFLIGFADRLHLRSERIAGYSFLFATPWAWLLDHDWFGYVHSPFVQSLISYAVILWIPAILYSACLWLLLQSLGIRARRSRV
jgi:hypothetical protein